jgi:hypothetical protein
MAEAFGSREAVRGEMHPGIGLRADPAPVWRGFLLSVVIVELR